MAPPRRLCNAGRRRVALAAHRLKERARFESSTLGVPLGFSGVSFELPASDDLTGPREDLEYSSYPSSAGKTFTVEPSTRCDSSQAVHWTVLFWSVVWSKAARLPKTIPVGTA